ncbi:MAG: hydantoinase B/oxoprolinase family protein [Rhodospirillales bacterium]|nr:hydantoinase B/oxoprolinase family protein [Rhodospirillales bacterium]
MTTETLDRIDPITFEVLRSQFEYTCERMTTVLQRSSFSPILSDMVDFSNAIYDANLQLLAQAANCPVHLAAMKFSAEAVITRFSLDDVHEGDVFVLNDPFQGGTHIPDITFVMPVFFDGSILGFAVSRGHWMDLGGGAAGGQSYGTHIAAEGLRLPPIRLYSNYEPNRDIVEIILSNTRTPHYIKGDMQAHFGALRAAESELHRTAERYGADVLRVAMKELQEYTERIIRKSIEAIPDGEYEGEDYADTDGFREKIKIKLKLIIKGSDIIVDFEGSDPQCQGAINSPFANTASAVFYSLQFFLSPDAPQNQGMFNPISIKLPENCWLNAKWPSPTIGCTTLASSKITSALWQALAKAIPDRVTGSTYAECNWFVASVRDRFGNTEVFSELPAGGWGGTPYSDGMSVTQDPLGNCMNMPAETAELLFPIAYEAFEFRKDSAGSGRYRGGVGATFKVRFLGDGELSMESSRTMEGSPGVNTPFRSAVQRQTKIGVDGSTEVIGGLTHNGDWKSPLLSGEKFDPGETFMFESTGGGGWGNPYDRPVEEVLNDVLDDFVSIEAARDQYGVVIDRDNLTVDQNATAQCRAKGVPVAEVIAE